MTQQYGSWPGGHDGSAPGGPGDDFGDLDGFGGEYRPEAAFPLDLNALTDGPHDFQILSAALKKNNNGDRLCELTLQELGGPRIRWTWWLNAQSGVNTHCADLAALGFPAHTWGIGPAKVPLSQALPAAIAQLAGKKFRGHKSSRRGQCKVHNKNNCPQCPDDGGVSGGKWFHDLRINCPLDGRPMPALTLAQPAATVSGFNPAPLNGPQPVAAPAGGIVPF